MENLIIRPAIIEDIPAILIIENASFKKPWEEKDYQYEINENPVSFLSVIEHPTFGIIGFSDYWITFDSATVAKIAINPSFRRQHLASLLFKDMIADCYAQKVKTITLEVRESNVAAISFYKKWGFIEVVTKLHYYEDGEDALYMMKEVKI